MLTAIKSELIRIMRPSFLYGGLGLIVGFSAMLTAFVFSAAGDSTFGSGPGPQMAGLAELSAQGGFAATLSTITSLIGVITLAYWAIAVATDYDTGLIRILTQAEPNRMRLLGGKVGALALFTVVATFVVTAVVTIMSYVLAPVFDVPTELWSTAFLTEFLSAWANLTVAALVWGLVGLALAMFTKSSGIAIAVGIGYLMVFENLIGIVAENATDYLPGGTLSALSMGGTDNLGYLTAFGLAIVYGTIAIGSSAIVFHRREITS
jgi:ABC-2 type transport system permease protein